MEKQSEHAETSFLVRLDLDPFLKDIEGYKVCLEAVTSLVFVSINQSHILPTGPFFLLVVPQVNVSSQHSTAIKFLACGAR